MVVRRPNIILSEMLRVGRTGIVSVPNFGFWKVPFDLFLMGRMPKTKSLPFEWYNTPNIHLCTIKDIQHFCSNNNITIKRQINMLGDRRNHPLANLYPNLFADLAIFIIQKNSSSK